jgi:hypothetical protein
MRLTVSAVFFAAVSVSFAPSASADRPRASTTWSFRVIYSTGPYSESHDPAESGSVLMYTGASWRCTRDAVSLMEDGKLLGGFVCRQATGTARVFVTAACPATSEGIDHAEATISDSTTKAFMRLSAFCSTKAAATRPDPTKSTAPIESNL